ncbi:MAG: hypothetical protein KDD61_09330 [Bdellovibrionales bacterium]|nr:hypothetical protein [Bdellovibrionales bacterium]
MNLSLSKFFIIFVSQIFWARISTASFCATEWSQFQGIVNEISAVQGQLDTLAEQMQTQNIDYVKKQKTIVDLKKRQEELKLDLDTFTPFLQIVEIQRKLLIQGLEQADLALKYGRELNLSQSLSSYWEITAAYLKDYARRYHPEDPQVVEIVDDFTTTLRSNHQVSTETMAAMDDILRGFLKEVTEHIQNWSDTEKGTEEIISAARTVLDAKAAELHKMDEKVHQYEIDLAAKQSEMRSSRELTVTLSGRLKQLEDEKGAKFWEHKKCAERAQSVKASEKRSRNWILQL